MIVFDLKCAAQGHVFEAWFGSSEDYEAQRQRGLVQCPLCGDADVAKAVMAPNVPAKGGSETISPAQMKTMLAALGQAQREMLKGSDYVGEAFASEARAIHLGETDARSIHGRATREEARSLAEEGVPVAPLPFPVAEPGQEN
jgi:hypothetical protein